MHSMNDGTALGQAEPAGRWYALYTRYQHEKVVADLLARKGFETFLPLYTAVHRWKDRVKTLTLPLYPSYVFLRGGLEPRLAILTTPGVIGIVGFAGRPGVIPQTEIEAVRRVIDSSLKAEPHPFLKCGERVRVVGGPLGGIEGILVRKKSFYRLVLSVELLQKSIAVEIDAWMIEPVGQPQLGSVPARVATPVFA